MSKNAKGGQRRGAGRKPSADPKQPVTIHVETSIIDSLGGKEGVQFLCYGAIYGEKRAGVVGPEFTAPNLPHPEPSFVATSSKRVVKKGSGLAAPTSVLNPQEQPKIKLQPRAPMVVSGAPKTLDELKSLCPAGLTGLDRSEWIRNERQKYGI